MGITYVETRHIATSTFPEKELKGRARREIISKLANFLARAKKKEKFVGYTLSDMHGMLLMKRLEPEIFESLTRGFGEVGERLSKVIEYHPHLIEVTDEFSKVFGLSHPWFEYFVYDPEDNKFKVKITGYDTSVCEERAPKGLKGRELRKFIEECLEEGMRPFIKKHLDDVADVNCEYRPRRGFECWLEFNI